MNYSEQINACAKNEIKKVNRTFCSSKINQNNKGTWQDYYMKSKEEKEIEQLKKKRDNKQKRLELLDEISKLDDKFDDESDGKLDDSLKNGNIVKSPKKKTYRRELDDEFPSENKDYGCGCIIM